MGAAGAARPYCEQQAEAPSFKHAQQISARAESTRSKERIPARARATRCWRSPVRKLGLHRNAPQTSRAQPPSLDCGDRCAVQDKAAWLRA
eukprot:10001656-Alexandrium_andersonii.AAC.1